MASSTQCLAIEQAQKKKVFKKGGEYRIRTDHLFTASEAL